MFETCSKVDSIIEYIVIFVVNSMMGKYTQNRCK